MTVELVSPVAALSVIPFRMPSGSLTQFLGPILLGSYYYVRVEQTVPPGGYGALAWASPMWTALETDGTDKDDDE